jgi:hypothetical protein
METGASAASIAQRYEVRVQTLLWWSSEFKRRNRRVSKAQRLVSVEIQPPLLPFGADASFAHSELKAVVETKRGRLTVHGPLSDSRLAVLVGILRV